MCGGGDAVENRTQSFLSPSLLQAVAAAVAHLAQLQQQQRQQREQQQQHLCEAGNRGVDGGAEAEAGATSSVATPSCNNAAGEGHGQELASRITGSDAPSCSSGSSDSSALLGGGSSGSVAALIRRRPDLVASVLAQTPQQCVEEWQSMAQNYK